MRFLLSSEFRLVLFGFMLLYLCYLHCLLSLAYFEFKYEYQKLFFLLIVCYKTNLSRGILDDVFAIVDLFLVESAPADPQKSYQLNWRGYQFK